MSKCLSMLVVSFGATSLFAFPLLPQDNYKFGAKSDENCVNFSGHWKGTCNYPTGKQSNDDLELTQTGCEVLKTKEVSLLIGGTKNVVDTFPSGGMVAYNLSLDWNKEKTALQLKEVLLSKFEGTPHAADFNGKLHFDNKKLVLHVESADGKKLVSCEYEKA